MSNLSLARLVGFAALLAIGAGSAQACHRSIPGETVAVSLRNSDTFVYPTVGGDEEGARISVQAEHFRISEIRRGEETNWVATYVYQPVSGYIGSDSTELEILTGSDGASPPDVRKVVLRFSIRD